MIITAYGVVSSDDNDTEVYGEFGHLLAWATRPGESWPCSDLAMLDSISVKFDRVGDMTDMKVMCDSQPVESVDLDANELNAWVSDVLRAAGLPSHPAIREAVTTC